MHYAHCRYFAKLTALLLLAMAKVFERAAWRGSPSIDNPRSTLVACTHLAPTSGSNGFFSEQQREEVIDEQGNEASD